MQIITSFGKERGVSIQPAESEFSIEFAEKTLSLTSKDLIRLVLSPTAFPWCIAEVLHCDPKIAFKLFPKIVHGSALKDRKRITNHVDVWDETFTRMILAKGIQEIPEITEEAYREMLDFHDELCSRPENRVHSSWKIIIANHRTWLVETYQQLKEQLKSPRLPEAQRATKLLE